MSSQAHTLRQPGDLRAASAAARAPRLDGLRNFGRALWKALEEVGAKRAEPHLRSLAKRREHTELSVLASQYGAAFGGPIGAPAQPAKKAEYVERVYL